MVKKDEPTFLPEEGIENRRAARVDARFEIEFSGRSVAGSGTVRNISATGALVQDPEPPLSMGDEITLRFCLYEGATPISVRATVVREVAEGCAVEFLQMDPRTRKILKTTLARARSVGVDSTPLHRDPKKDPQG